MQNYTYKTRGVCASQISFDMENGKIYNVSFSGGCPGNTAAISKLLEGMNSEKLVDILKGNDCGGRGTSCADQLAMAVEEVMSGKA